MSKCNYKSPWTDSGDRGADMASHEREYHPDHKHVWGENVYEWDKDTVRRCVICRLNQDYDNSGLCK